MDIQRRHCYYKYIVKRYLNEIQTSIRLSKNEMERSYYVTHYAVQLEAFADALGVQKKRLEQYINK